ncbi:MHYT domain-containing signal sensor [Pilimelia terevasa]|uniref:MHYT domain-containing signal sensor n=1 Tax=Pilimelia terevasa TaxID=53372 RepID=A0A8J3BQ05_9ACTN|nr:MHYT domain-containing protein [Pilimelia terevasa]GGK38655.1 MHYT domain-containing signal sensor [Pilimelia terevasa]
MAEIHHFTYGWFTPVVAFLMAFLGSLLGLVCTARARESRTAGRRARWLVIAATAIGGTGIWLMHFMAMLGFEVPVSPVRFDPWLTLLSMMLAVVPVGVGLFLVGWRAPSLPRILCGGLFTGFGVLGMHYTGMAGLRLAGTMEFDLPLVAASALIAVVAATAALWFTTIVKGWGPILAAATTMAVAVCGMHYTGMAAIRVHLAHDPAPVDGINPFSLLVPITLLAAAALIGMAFSALQAMTEEEFDGDRSGARAAAAESGGDPAWSLRQVSLAAAMSAPTAEHSRVS